MTFITLQSNFFVEQSTEFYYSFSQDNFMCEKESKLSQPVPILDEISVWLLDAIHRNINKKGTIILQNLHFRWVFWRKI